MARRSTAKKSKRVGFFFDPHVGHQHGLHAARWRNLPFAGAREKQRAIAQYQKAQGEWVEARVKEHGPFDVAVYPGDMVTGKGSRKGGVEVILPDLNDQVDAAVDVVQMIGAPVNRFYYGTAYHVSPHGEDLEALIAKECGAPAPKDHGFLEVNGVTFHVKHHVGSSSREHTAFTAPAGEAVTALLEAERGLYPKADVIIRGHRHKVCYCGRPGWWLAIVGPSLCGSSAYGARRCSGETDLGFLVFDIDTGGNYTWQAVLADLPERRYRAESL